MSNKSEVKSGNYVDEIQNLITDQRSYYSSGKTRDIRFRKEQLLKLRKLIKFHEKDINEALDKDFKKSSFETYISEIGVLISEIDHTIRHLRSWARRKRVKTPILAFPSSSYIITEPYGLVLIIGPWNYPFQLQIAPLIGALAAGNCAILKPSEQAPHISRFLTRMINENFDSNYLKVIEGGVEISKSLLEQKFDYIFFTGGTEVGKIVAAAAAENLTPHTLELGGKSPAIVDQNTDLSLVAKRIVWGKYINAGQTCIAPDFIYAHKDIKDELIRLIGLEIKSAYGDNPFHSPDYPRIINRQHYERLKALIDPMKLVIGGDTNDDENYIAPTVMDNMTWEDPAMADEIFGPVLPVLVFDEISEVIKELGLRPKPLALYIFSRDKSLQKTVLNELSFGGGTVNDTIMHFLNPDLPFGGVGNSGYGSYHGKFNFHTFSHHKPIMYRSNLIDIPIRYAPYKGKIKLLKWAYKINRNFWI
ncbi:aldehyde dehydrogenase [Bacteroidota bacterium]